MLLTSLVLLAAPALPQSSAEFELAQDKVELELDLSTGHAALMVSIDGAEPVLFQVDTYASIEACIDDDVAKKLGLTKVGTALNSDGRNVRSKDIVRIDQLDLGAAQFLGVTALVDDYDWIVREDGKKVSGLLGFTLFKELLLTFDYPGSKLILSRGELKPDAPHVIPYESTSGSPDIRVQVGEQEFLFGIDTGAKQALSLDRKDAESLQLASELKQVASGRTAYTEFKIWHASLADQVLLAGHKLDDVVASFSGGATRRLIGYGAFKHLAMTFDQKRQLVRFVAPE